jgi:DNA-binding NtrC family response regulator
VILIVDDDPVFLGAATAALTVEQNHVLAAPNVARALELIDKIGSEIGVALIDLNLGSASGFDLIRDIKTIDANLPVIAFSGACTPATLESAMMLGAVEVLRKPINREWIAAIDRARRQVRNSTRSPHA